MKHLLYLNKEYLYSYYAQAFDGIDKITQKAVSDATVSEEERVGESITHKGDASVNLFGIAKIGGGNEVAEENVNTRFITLEAARDVATVALHDNALDRVIEHSKSEREEENKIGDYVEIVGAFQMVDFQYWIDMLTDNFINDAINGKWETYCNSFPNPGAKEIQNGKKSFLDREKKLLLDTKKKFELLKTTSMSDVVMVVNNIIIPMKRECMKEDSREMLIKYESPVHVFGRLTRRSQHIENNSKGMLSDMSKSLTDMWINPLYGFGILKKDGMCTVIDPMAIYVE